MVYKLGNISDMDRLPVMDSGVRAVIRDHVMVLTKEYGADRDVDNDDGGFVLYVTPGTPADEITAEFDYTKSVVEQAWLAGNAGSPLCVALYLLNNEFSVTVIMSAEDAPKEIAGEMEGGPEWNTR